jgi:K+-sensing histidine kinase KdpD
MPHTGAERLRELAAASLEITAAATLDERLAVITERARAIIGARLAVTSLAQGPGDARRISAASRSHEHLPWHDEDNLPGNPELVATVCRSKRPARLTRAELAPGPGVPLRGWLAAPMIAGDGRNLGLIQLADKEEGEFSPDDEAVLVQLAQLAAAGVENAQLYEGERAERKRAQRVAERLGRLQEVTGAIAAATTPEQVAEAAVRHGMASVGAAAGALGILTGGGARIVRLAMIGYPREIVEATGDVPIDDVGPIGTVARTGEALWLESSADLLARYPRLAAIRARQNYGATVVVPLALEERVLGVLSLRFAEDRPFDAGERDLILAVAHAAALALERSRLYQEATREAARRGALASASQLFAQASLDRERVAEAALRIVAETIGDGGILRLLSEDGEHLDPVAAYHPNAEARALMQKLSVATRHGATEGLQGRTVQTGTPVRLTGEEWAAQRGVSPPAYWPFFDRFGQAGMLIVPLRVRDRVIGTLGVSRDEPGQGYTAADEHFLQELADRAALALENARLYERAQEAVRARDQFLSIASHELRTPVTTIRGYAQLLLRAHAQGPIEPERLARYLTTIDLETGRLGRLTQDLLDVSRLQTGQLQLAHQPLDLAQLARTIGVRFAEQGVSGHRLVAEVPDAPCMVLGDADRIEQVLSNLLENAAKYSPGDGAIALSLAVEAGQAVVRVRDEGIGLAPGATEAIFEPFGRAANATSKHIPGLGLGLYICRDLIARHGGRIWAESPGEGRGTTFVVTLPLGA